MTGLNQQPEPCLGFAVQSYDQQNARAFPDGLQAIGGRVEAVNGDVVLSQEFFRPRMNGTSLSNRIHESLHRGGHMSLCLWGEPWTASENPSSEYPQTSGSRHEVGERE